MAAGGGRGTGTAFGKEGEDMMNEDLINSAGGLTITRLQARNARLSQREEGNESGTDTSSEISSAATSISGVSSDENGVAPKPAEGNKKVDGGEGEIWSGGASCVVGLQKRGLRGLMEGRRIREKERGRTVGGLGSPTPGQGSATDNGDGHQGVNGASAGAAVGLGIA